MAERGREPAAIVKSSRYSKTLARLVLGLYCQVVYKGGGAAEALTPAQTVHSHQPRNSLALAALAYGHARADCRSGRGLAGNRSYAVE
jgi:hypothetical protein